MHLIVDEADLFAPQMPETAQERRSLKAMNDLTRRYRSKGFGATLISQRPAVFHKNVLSMIDVLISLRVVSPQYVDALDKWIKSTHPGRGRGLRFRCNLDCYCSMRHPEGLSSFAGKRSMGDHSKTEANEVILPHFRKEGKGGTHQTCSRGSFQNRAPSFFARSKWQNRSTSTEMGNPFFVAFLGS
jgi:hypothetical protein